MARLATKKTREKTCLICDEKQKYGIHIGREFICADCEKRVISTETNDSRYSYYLKRLEKLKESIHM